MKNLICGIDDAQQITAWSGADEKFNTAWRTLKVIKMNKARRLQPEQCAQEEREKLNLWDR